MHRVVIDLHGSRAQEGVDIDALESFLEHFRAALREHVRAGRGAISRKGGRPFAHESAATALRLVDFRTGSGIATLAPSLGDAEELVLDESGEPLALTTVCGVFDGVARGVASPSVIEALSSARKAIGEDGRFGVRIGAVSAERRIEIDKAVIDRLSDQQAGSVEGRLAFTGRLHLIEADQPNRRVGIRAQDGTDWSCTYPDALHAMVTTLLERLVRVTGEGRLLTAGAGRLRIETIDLVEEFAQDPLFSVEPIPVERLLASQGIAGPQGLEPFVDPAWQDDEQSRRFLEATLGTE